MLSSDSWLIDIGERSHPVPNPMHRSSGCSSATSKTGNRFGWSFFFAVWRRCARSQLRMNSVVLVESQESCALVRIVRLHKIWQEGQHDLHSPPQPIDWREHTIGAVHDRNLPSRSLQVPESHENFLWHRVKVRSIVTGLRHDDERDDDRSHRRVSIMSSLDAGWFRLITNILIQSRDLAMVASWHQYGTMTSQMVSRASFSSVCLTVFLFEFRPRTFTIGFYGKLYHIRAYDFGVQFSFNSLWNAKIDRITVHFVEAQVHSTSQ